LSAVLFAPGIVGVFVRSPEVIAEGSRFLRISGWGFGLGGALMVIQGAFQGAGRTEYSMILSVLNRWLLRLPVAALLAWGLNLGIHGIWWSFLLSDIAGFLIGVAWLRWGAWQQRLVEKAGSSSKRPPQPERAMIYPDAGRQQPFLKKALPPKISIRQTRIDSEE
ncbi:MAG TPA: MATE family efflux transporter, partial [Anaerolineae bacterium]|nr:MATE family efflux transporter [Anaerolineae bacterium]